MTSPPGEGTPGPTSPSPAAAEAARAGLPRLHYGWAILVMGTLVVFGSLGLGRFGYTVVLPAMQAGLGLDNTAAGFLASANLLGYATLSLLGGLLAARFGPRAVIAAGLFLAGGGMMLTAGAQGLLSAAAFRVLTGVGSGLSNVPVMGLLAAWFGARRRGMAAGVVVTGSSIGLILVGPLVPRFLATQGGQGWRWVWVIYGTVSLLLAVLAYAVLRNRPGDRSLEPMCATPSEIQAARSAHRAGGGGQGLQWDRVYRSRAVYHLGAVYSAFGFAYIIYMTFFTKYLVGELGYASGAAGDLLMALGWASLLCGVVWGSLSDIIGRKAALVMVFLIQTVAFSIFGLWQAPTGSLISGVLFGLTAWGVPAIMAATCGDVLGARLAPAALGLITLFFALGQALGPTLAGAIADNTGSFAPAFILGGVVSLLGAGGAALLRPASTQGARRVLVEGGGSPSEAALPPEPQEG